MTTWFTSDTHFGHANIIKYCNRPFSSTNEMDETLITNWNALVKPQDEVWHLGDFAFGRDVSVDRLWQIFARLHGIIHFIEGNHDQLLTDMLRADHRLSDIRHYREITVHQQRIVLFHYGLRTWRHDLRGAWHLYGHSHGGLPSLGKSVDVGVDIWGMKPVSFETLKSYMEAQPIHKAPAFANFEGSM